MEEMGAEPLTGLTGMKKTGNITTAGSMTIFVSPAKYRDSNLAYVHHASG